MKRSTSTLRRAALVCAFLCIGTSSATAANLPRVENVDIDGDRLTWEPVAGATGYNIRLENRYLTTVRNTTAFTVTATGTYAVIAFDDDGNFSPAVFAAGDRPFFEGAVDERPSVLEIADGAVYVTERCLDVTAGQSCTARCPDAVGLAAGGSATIGAVTGGACGSSDSVGVNARIRPDEYRCTVAGFTARVEAQAVCLITSSRP